MPRRKPLGWPRYMVARQLRSGTKAYYWVIPTWAKKKGCLLACRNISFYQTHATAA